MTGSREAATRQSYDRIASAYWDRFEHELDDKPFDREFLDAVAAVVSPERWVVDLGSGPGQIGAYLARRGSRVLSLDLSFGMVRLSRALSVSRAQVQATMRSLPFGDATIGDIVAFFSIIHIPPSDLSATMIELQRVVMPGGHVALTAHATAPPDRRSPREPAPAVLHREEMLETAVDLDFYFYRVDDLRRALEDVGFTILQGTERDPYSPDVEAQTRRAYVVARKPSSGGRRD